MLVLYGVVKNGFGELGTRNKKPIKQYRKVHELSAMYDYTNSEIYAMRNKMVVFKKDCK